MKKFFTALFVSVFLANALLSSVVFTTNIDQATFESAFEEAVFNFTARPGANSGSNSHEFQLGQGNNINFLGDISATNDWANNTSHPLSISINEAGFLSATVNGVTTPIGNQPGITDPFNEIWVGVSMSTSFDEDVLSISHSYGSTFLPNISLTGSDTEPQWIAFNFYDDERTTNIASFDIDVDLLIEFFGGPTNTGSLDEWNYTVFGRFNESIIPEPNSYPLLFGLTTILFTLIRRQR